MAAPRLARAATSFESIADTAKAIDGRTFTDLSSPQAMLRPGGRALFTARATYQGQKEDGLWVLKDDHLSLVVSEKEDLGGEDMFVHLEFGNEWQFDSKDGIAGWIRTGSNYEDALVYGQPGKLSPLLSEGEVDPSLPDATLFSIRMFPSAVSPQAVVVGGYVKPFEPNQTTRAADDVRSWLLADGMLRPFVNMGDAAPTAPESKLTGGPAVYAIDAEGRILFGASTTAGSGYLFTATHEGAIELVTRVAELPAPFAEPDISLARLSKAGTLTVVSDGYAVGSDILETTIWSGKPDSLELLARSAEAPQTGEASPGGSHVLWDLDLPAVSQSGEWMALKGRADIYSAPGLWVGRPGQLHEILREDETIAGTANVRCIAIDEVQINEHGQLVIFAQTSLASTVFRYDPQAGLELIASDTTPITLDGEEQSGYMPYRDREAISDDGRVYLMAVRREGTKSSHTFMRSAPLLADDDAPGQADGGAGGVGASDDDGGAADAEAGGSTSGPSAGGESGASSQSEGPSSAGPASGSGHKDGCSVAELGPPSSFAFALPWLFVGLLLARKRSSRCR